MFCHFGPSFALWTPSKPKKSKPWKNERKTLEISSFYIIAQKIMIRWCTVPEIWCMTAQKIKILEKWSISLQISSFYICVPKIMIRWCMLPETWCVTDVIIFQLGPFLSFYPCNILKNQNFEKMKQTPRDIIILHICTKNYDQMMYASWDMVCDRCNCYFSFWAIFCPFTP